MLVLSATTDAVQVDLGSAHTTNPLRVFATWRDITATGYTPGRNVVNTNGTTAVVAVPAPGASTQRVVDTVNVYNSDTTSKVVTLEFSDNGTVYTLASVTLAAGERLEYVDGSGVKVYAATTGAMKTSLNQGAAPATSGLQVVTLAADVVNNNATANTIADVTGLSFPVTSGTRYRFRFVIFYSAAATATGSRWSVSGPTFTELSYSSRYSLTATSETVNYAVAYDIPAASNATSANTAGNCAVIEGIVRPSADGSVIARFASEVSSSAITAKIGSYVEYMAL